MKRLFVNIARYLPIALLVTLVVPGVRHAVPPQLLKADQAVSLSNHNQATITNTTTSWIFANDGGTCNMLPTESCPGQYGQNFPSQQDSTNDTHSPPLPGFSVFDASLNSTGGFSFEYGMEIWSRDSTQGAGTTKTVFAAPGDLATRRDQSLFAGPVQIAGPTSLSVQVTYTVLPNLPVLRTLVTYSNSSTDTVVSVTNTVATNLEDQTSVVTGTSSGANDTTFDNTDRWIVTHGSGGTNPFITHVLYGPDSPQSTTTAGTAATTVYSTTPATQSSNRDGVRSDRSVSIPPSSSKSFMYFSGLSADRTDADTLSALFNTTPSFGSEFVIGLTAKELKAVANWDFKLDRWVLAGGGSNSDPVAKVFAIDPSGNAIGTEPLATVTAFDSGFRGGVRVASGDLDGSGPEIIVAAGPPGGPHVKVFKANTATGQVSTTVWAEQHVYDSGFGGGVYVAAADVDGDGKAEVITGAGENGGPHVKIWDVDADPDNPSLGKFTLKRSFYADNPFVGTGVRVAAGNVVEDAFGDSRSEIITTTGPGAPTRVRVWRVNSAGALSEVLIHETRTGTDVDSWDGFYPFGAGYTAGAFVGVGDVTGTSTAEIIAGSGGNIQAQAKVFSLSADASLSTAASFFPYSSFTGAVRIGTVQADGDTLLEVITGAGPPGGPDLELWNLVGVSATDPLLNPPFYAFNPSYGGGIFVSGMSTNVP